MSTRDSYIFFDQDTAFQGEVNTDHLVLEGSITGDVHASKDVMLKQGALVQGEISTKKYTIEEGSIHQGKLRMDLSKKASKTSSSEAKNTRRISHSVSKANGTDGMSTISSNGSADGNSPYTRNTSVSSIINGSNGENGKSHQKESPSQNGHHHHGNGENDDEQESVFELINKVKDPVSQQETNGHSEDKQYTEAPPRERLW